MEIKMLKFNLCLSGLCFGVETRFESVKNYCKNYITESRDTVGSVAVSEEKIDREIAATDEDVTREYAESVCIYREIAELLPDFDRAVFHGAAITYKDKGFIFTAPSGTGKSTHIKLWRKYLGDSVDIVNGDKPILMADTDSVSVHSSPWCGKEGWNKNRSAELSAICIIQRGLKNRIKKISGGDALTYLIKQIYRPKNPLALAKTLELFDRILKKVPVFVLECDMSEEAVKTSFEAMTGEEYKKAP